METAKVLIIDDDPMTCKLLETVLQMEDYLTTSANAIEEDDIITLLAERQPNFLILDYHLGSKETLSFVSIIRSSKIWQNLPILMTSGIDHRRDSLDAGANEFILKPFDWQEITEYLNNMRDDLVCQEA